MGVLRVFLIGVAGAFASVAVFGLWLASDHHPLLGLPVAAGAGVLAWAVFQQARRYTIQSTEAQQAEFEETVRQLAAKGQGTVGISAILNATGYTRDRAEAKMRELIGRGVFDMDFADSGEMQFKLTPIDEARAQLAGVQGKQLPPHGS